MPAPTTTDEAIAKANAIGKINNTPQTNDTGVQEEVKSTQTETAVNTSEPQSVVTTSTIRQDAEDNAKLVDDKIAQKITQTIDANGTSVIRKEDNKQEDIYDEMGQIKTASKDWESQREEIYNSQQKSSDVAYNDIVENTKAQFNILRTQLADSNRRYQSKTTQNQYMNNGFRYTPQQAEGMVYNVEQAGLARMSELAYKESTALLAAKQAKESNDISMLDKYVNDVKNIQSERINILKSMSDQLKTIEETDKNIKNMNQNEANIMNSLISSYTYSAQNIPASEREEYYKKQAEQISEVLGFKVAPEFLKAQIEGAESAASLTPDPELSKKNKVYTDTLGKPMLTADGKTIPYDEKEDWYSERIGNTLNVGTYNEDGRKVIETYELSGVEPTKGTTSTATAADGTVTGYINTLQSVYNGPMTALLSTPDGSFVKTTNKAYANIGNGGMQCAEFVNRIMGTTFGDTLAQKLTIAKDSTGQIGSAAVWDPANTGTSGHNGIIVGEEGNNWIIKSANLRGNGIISTDVVPKSAIKGYYTSEKVKSMSNELAGEYDPLQDNKLTPIGQNKDGSPIFLDTRTNQTISGDQAKSMYGDTTKKDSGIGSDPDMRSITIGKIAFGKTISDKERESVMNIIKKYPDVPNNEIALMARGMYLDNPQDTDTAVKYVNVFNNMENPPDGYESQVATYLNKGDITGLNRYVDNQIEIDLKKRIPSEEFISNSSYISGKQNTEILLDLIDRNQSKIGAFDGRAADLLKKVKDDPEYQTIKTLLSMSVAEVRRKFAGSAVTDTEMSALEDFIGGKTTMTAGNLKTYLQTILDKTTREYDNQRSIYGAPGNTAQPATAPVSTPSNSDWSNA